MRETIKESNNTMSLVELKASRRRILMAEDDKSAQDVITKFLKLKGFDVALAENGIEALTLFKGSPFDIVLTDFQMPSMDGLCLATHIKKRSPKIPIVLLTGYGKDEILKKVENGPFYTVLFKPFSMGDLHRTIQSALSFM